MKFSEFDIEPRVQEGIAQTGYVECTPVQQQALPHALQGKDIMIQSQTGTGKTAAYLIPSFHVLLTHPHMHNKSMLVLSPTRELAQQISEEGARLGAAANFKMITVIGGVGYQPQIDALQKEDEQPVIIGTPGRIIDHVKSHHLDLRRVGILVIDEADRMFDMGFYPDVSRIIRGMVATSERITMLLSATLSVRARNIAWRHMHNVVEIEIEPEQKTVNEIEQKLYHLSKDEKISFLIGYLKHHQPDSVLIFTNMRSKAEWVSKMMAANDLDNRFISGALPQKERSRLLDQLKSRQIQYLVATDVAARGLHIEDLAVVVNYDLPEDTENYVHRIGRTARAGKGGVAISLACEQYVYNLENIEKYIDTKIPVETVAAEDFAAEIKYVAHVAHARRTGARDDRRGTERERLPHPHRSSSRKYHSETPRRTHGQNGQRRAPAQIDRSGSAEGGAPHKVRAGARNMNRAPHGTPRPATQQPQKNTSTTVSAPRPQRKVAVHRAQGAQGRPETPPRPPHRARPPHRDRLTFVGRIIRTIKKRR